MDLNFSSWDEFFLQCYRRMFARAYRLTHDADRAQDLVQETCVRVVSSALTPVGIQRPLAFVFRVMRNAFIDGIRKAKRVKLISTEDLHNPEFQNQHPVYLPNLQQALENKETIERLKSRRGPLSPADKDLFELLSAGKDCEEISEILCQDIRITRADLNALKSKLRYRLRPFKP